MNEHEIRRQLHDLAERYGDADDLRAQVRARLEALDRAPGIRLTGDVPAPNASRRWLAAAATVAVIGAAVVAVSVFGRGADQDRLAVDPADDPIPAVSAPVGSVAETIVVAPGERVGYVSSLTDPPIEFEVPVVADLSIELAAESDQLVEFDIESPDVTGGHLALVVPPVADVESVDEVLEWLRSSLSQTELVDVDDVVVGGTSAVRVRLESSVEMTLTGFRLGPRTFVSASGIDRSYEAYVVSRPDGGVLIVWVDAARSEIDAVRPVAEVVTGSLTGPG